MNRGVSTLIGVGIQMGGMFLSSMGNLLMRKAQLDNAKSPVERAKPWYTRPVWYIIFLFLVANGACDFAAYQFASMAILAPLGAVATGVNMVVAYFLLGEVMSVNHAVGSLVMVAGACVAVWSGPPEPATDATLEVMKQNFLSQSYRIFFPIKVFLMICCVTYINLFGTGPSKEIAYSVDSEKTATETDPEPSNGTDLSDLHQYLLPSSRIRYYGLLGKEQGNAHVPHPMDPHNPFAGYAASGQGGFVRVSPSENPSITTAVPSINPASPMSYGIASPSLQPPPHSTLLGTVTERPLSSASQTGAVQKGEQTHNHENENDEPDVVIVHSRNRTAGGVGEESNKLTGANPGSISQQQQNGTSNPPVEVAPLEEENISPKRRQWLKVRKQLLVVSWAFWVSGVGAWTNLLGKAITKLIAGVTDGTDTLGSYQLWLLVLLLVCVAVCQFKSMAMQMARFPAVQIMPTFNCCFILNQLFEGGFFFQEFYHFVSVQKTIYFGIGVIMCMVGITIASRIPAPAGQQRCRNGCARICRLFSGQKGERSGSEDEKKDEKQTTGAEHQELLTKPPHSVQMTKLDGQEDNSTLSTSTSAQATTASTSTSLLAPRAN